MRLEVTAKTFYYFKRVPIPVYRLKELTVLKQNAN